MGKVKVELTEEDYALIMSILPTTHLSLSADKTDIDNLTKDELEYLLPRLDLIIENSLNDELQSIRTLEYNILKNSIINRLAVS